MSLRFTDTDFQRLAQFDPAELARLYRFLLDRLRDCAGLTTVLTVRVPQTTVDHMKVLAYRYQMTRSELARRAVMEFLQRNPL